MVTAEASTMTLTVVDDEPLARDVLVRAARLWEYHCQPAASAEEALDLLQAKPTPIVVTDLRMPGRGGVWLVQEIRRRWPDVAIIVVTAGHDTEAAIECLNAGAQHYFLKPIKLDEFRHALECTAKTYHLEQENLRYKRHLEEKVARQTRQIRRNFLSAIKSLVRTLEERDNYTAGHSLRVSLYSMALARVLGFDREMCRKLSMAAKLHDIGKIGIPDAILNKPGPLTPAEIHLVQQHPEIGERVLKPVIRNKEILSAIRSHHERLDGSGYPDGLCGSEIPLLARVITVADCFDALTTSRAYRRALPKSEALEVLRADAGTHFEPSLVDAFLEVAPSLGEEPV